MKKIDDWSKIDRPTLMKLLGGGLDPNQRDTDGATPLMNAVSLGDEWLVQKLINVEADVNVQDKDGLTALMIAAAILPDPKASQIARVLLLNGAKPELAKKDTGTALMFAAERNKLLTASTLIDHGAMITQKAMSVAISSKNKDIIQIFEERIERDNAVILDAAKKGEFEIVKAQLEQGVSANFCDGRGYSVLMHASSYGHLKILQLLLEKGAFVNYQSPVGTTALMLASSNGHQAIVSALLDNKAKTNLQDVLGWTALMMAAQNISLKVVALLLKGGAAPKQKNNSGQSSLNLLGRAFFRILFFNSLFVLLIVLALIFWPTSIYIKIVLGIIAGVLFIRLMLKCFNAQRIRKLLS